MEPDLAPCPFCGSVDLVFNRWTAGGTAYVHCRQCLADGPYFGTDDGEDDAKAVRAWNTRHQQRSFL